MRNNIVASLLELTKNDSAGKIETLKNVIDNYEDIKDLVEHHGINNFHKIDNQLLLYKDRKVIFASEVDSNIAISLWGKSGVCWEKRNF